ncbi:glycosyltransferase [Candidatus Pseudothioglobus singularis]|nr:glycosyltransferase [Candidatus Pseudothioglobus singularis]
MPKISIIIRTKDEERWIGHCLKSIFSQKVNALIEVIIVDNLSKDKTVEIASRYAVQKIISVTKYLPGKAINDGIRSSSGDYIVCISAHCIPYNDKWLETMYQNLRNNKGVAGVYGRQIPLAYTSDSDKRDLLISFGKDKRIQIKDYFFHNANSMLSRDIWEKFPFDEEATNIEDRIWAKRVINSGFKIIYEPDASVYHYHGLHQHGNSSIRAKGIATILDNLDNDSIGDLPNSLKPENIPVAAVLLVNEKFEKNSMEFKLLKRATEKLKNSLYVDAIYVASYDENFAIHAGSNWIDRNQPIFNSNNINVEKLLKLSLLEIEFSDFFPEVILYVNHHYPFRPDNLFNDLITELQYKGLSSVFPSFADYGHYWKKNKTGDFLQIDSSMDSRTEREPFMRALYGLGCASSSVEIRKGNITGNNVGILSIDDFKFTLNARESGTNNIINKLLIDE